MHFLNSAILKQINLGQRINYQERLYQTKEEIINSYNINNINDCKIILYKYGLKLTRKLFDTDTLPFQIARIRLNPKDLRFISNKTIQICMEAVKRDPVTIKYIDKNKYPDLYEECFLYLL